MPPPCLTHGFVLPPPAGTHLRFLSPMGRWSRRYGQTPHAIAFSGKDRRGVPTVWVTHCPDGFHHCPIEEAEQYTIERFGSAEVFYTDWINDVRLSPEPDNDGVTWLWFFVKTNQARGQGSRVAHGFFDEEPWSLCTHIERVRSVNPAHQHHPRCQRCLARLRLHKQNVGIRIRSDRNQWRHQK